MRALHQHSASGHRHVVRDQRRSPRLEVYGQVDGHVVSLNRRVEMRDISLGGFAAVTGDAYRVGTVHEFRFTTFEGVTLELRARVAHCERRSDVWVTGFEFLHQERARVQDAIGTLIESVSGGLTFS